MISPIEWAVTSLSAGSDSTTRPTGPGTDNTGPSPSEPYLPGSPRPPIVSARLGPSGPSHYTATALVTSAEFLSTRPARLRYRLINRVTTTRCWAWPFHRTDTDTDTDTSVATHGHTERDNHRDFCNTQTRRTVRSG